VSPRTHEAPRIAAGALRHPMIAFWCCVVATNRTICSGTFLVLPALISYRWRRAVGQFLRVRQCLARCAGELYRCQLQ
jgi:hypothetical protein